MPLTRRTVLTGFCALAASGCGGGSGGTTGAAPAAAGTLLGPVDEVPVGGGRVFAAQGVVVVRPSEQEFRAFSATCTHTGCTVDEVAEGTIRCPCHGSRYDVADGSVVNGPAPRPLAPRAVVVEGGSLKLA